MYKGEYHHSIDSKGRITIPAKLRDELGEGYVITRAPDGCLWILDAKRWEDIDKLLAEIPWLTSREARDFSRFMVAGACDGEVDKQGRLLIPSHLREYAGLTKDVVFAGVGSRVEIWDEEKYNALNAAMDINTITDKLMEMGYRI
ncbi:MAG: division/cell wall cluster transcriptional repressor MraZ [Lachnospiraceae bacterium]|nr:division/cell wall cluster transcriptional repressor MraZ [Lachnospiraceae bacterium]